MLLFKNAEFINYLTAIKVNHSAYKYVVYDSEIEREFARKLDTRDFLKLRTSEADKARCGQKHFKALGVPFEVVVSAEEV